MREARRRCSKWWTCGTPGIRSAEQRGSGVGRAGRRGSGGAARPRSAAPRRRLVPRRRPAGCRSPRPGRRALELAADFGVHRLTARQAVTELKQAGLVIARQGMGTFVQGRARRIAVSGTRSTGNCCPRNSRPPLSCSAVKELVEHGLVGDAEAAGHLRVRGVRAGYRLTTVGRVSGEPWLVNSYALPAAFAGLADSWSRDGEILGLLNVCGHDWRYA
ncbi:GntR family transcriptional regulator [Streptomyces sp. SBC-4]|nr:GntR family transcriptional regulator [Streptomyces sp. SBC-4]MDV5142844.1 GntR family transcriptional regulator [Streptomyces sp. SBC-4]